MHYAALASGSKGNCHAFGDGERILLVDAGVSLRRTRTTLEDLGWDPAQVRAVAITHEHSDHMAHVGMFLKHTDWSFLVTPDTKAAVEGRLGVEIPTRRWIPIAAGHALDWGGWRILPFALPHDAADPVAYRLEKGSWQGAVVTDLGQPTALVADHIQDLDLLVLEANHDVEMLREGGYPPHLKARILSRVGHLSNEAMAELLARALCPRLRTVVLAHLSEQNNDPALARLAAQAVLAGRPETALSLASQREPLAIDLAS